MQKGDLEAVSSYLTELGDNLKHVDSAIKTGNVLADAIINSKISLAKSQEIQVRVDAHIPVKLSISDVDLCVILGNLFANAIEANRQLPEGTTNDPSEHGHEGEPAVRLLSHHQSDDRNPGCSESLIELHRSELTVCENSTADGSLAANHPKRCSPHLP